jgi:ApaG protein
MSTPEMSDTTTEGLRVGATAFYLPEESNPDEGKFRFGYRILIVNEGTEPAQLVSRHWIIVDAEGHREDVRGPGVVGQTPLLKPGEGFKYTSYCPLETPWGTMEGTYQMVRPDGRKFEAKIGRFYLHVPAKTQAPRAQPQLD